MNLESVYAMAEAAEAEFMYQYETMATPATKAALGIATTRIGDGVALSMRNDVTNYWSKSLGFGFRQPINDRLIGRIIDFYTAAGSSGATIQIAPSVLPAKWIRLCERYNLRPESQWIKLAGEISRLRPDTDLARDVRVEPVGPDGFDGWASATLRGFGMPVEGLSDMMAAALAHPDFRPFAAWKGDEIIATGNLFIHGQVGSLNSAATLANHRNQGAQSALIAARIRAAQEAGCRWVCAETGKPGVGEINTSLNNLWRGGLRPLYERQNWAWAPAPRRDQ